MTPHRAGRELDAEIRDAFFPLDPKRCRTCGWQLVESISEGCTKESCSMRWENIPHGRYDDPAPFSSSIAAAWAVVGLFVSMGKVFLVKGDGLRRGDHNPKWTVLCDNLPRVDAETAPLAICLAALAAVERRPE